MFILKTSDNWERTVTEADEQVKPACEVHGGNLFVQLHFKAIEKLPNSGQVDLINTVVTSKDESSATFSGCGRHMVAVQAADEESPINKEEAFKAIKAYLGVMFGQDIANNFTIDDVSTLLADGKVATPEQLKKWEEQQKKKDEEGGEEESVDESIPSFGGFMIGEQAEAAGDGEEDEDGEDDSDTETAGEEGEDGGGGDEDEDDDGGGEDEDDGGGDEDEAEAGEEEVPPPATFFAYYMIKAEGLPEEDHTDSKDIEKLTKRKMMLPGSKFNLGIEFRSGGATVDTINLKKLGKELKGDVDAEELNDWIGKIFSKNFPQVQTISRGIRDRSTVIDELQTMNFEEDDQYIRDALQKIGKSEYSFYMQLKDNPAKPYVNKKDVIQMVNASLKQMGGRWLKFMSGVSDKDVIELHATTMIGANTKADRDAVFRSVPEPEQI